MEIELLSPASKHYPKLLAERYPRILERIRALWGTPQIHDYFSDLLLDTRDGSRQGFPFEVAAEIVRLRDLNDLVTFRAAERKQDAVRRLQALGINLSSSNFLRAVRKGNQQLVDLFIRAGLHLPPNDDNIPLLIATLRRGHTVIAKMLIDAGVEVNVTDHLSLTPLLIACAKPTQGYQLIAEKLIARKADLNVQDPFGHTPLMLAISGGMFDIARLLIQNGADARAVSRKGESALDMLLARPEPVARELAELVLAPSAKISRPAESASILTELKNRSQAIREQFGSQDGGKR